VKEGITAFCLEVKKTRLNFKESEILQQFKHFNANASSNT